MAKWSEDQRAARLRSEDEARLNAQQSSAGNGQNTINVAQPGAEGEVPKSTGKTKVLGDKPDDRKAGS